ncbi:MAG: methionine adenosyltransferase domain-containing protein, partial [Desulfovibrionaceae bacterium]|nr:methionine adenosyltransferase domain-containing protein [Desulfovibrionaceae bacterium]
VPDEILTRAVKEVFDMRPYHIIKELNLKSPIYRKTTNYGHFGRELPGFRWEKTDKAAALKAAVDRM